MKVTTNYWRKKSVFTESKIISRDKSGSTRPYFKTTKALFEQIKKLEIPRVEMRYLSMGMSNSGPGGTRKPLVEFAFVDAWLKAGGSLIGLPLQYPSGELVRAAMLKLYGTDLNNYKGKIVFIQFDPFTNDCVKIKEDTLQANVVKPELWDKAIEMAEDMVEKTQSNNEDYHPL